MVWVRRRPTYSEKLIQVILGTLTLTLRGIHSYPVSGHLILSIALRPACLRLAIYQIFGIEAGHQEKMKKNSQNDQTKAHHQREFARINTVNQTVVKHTLKDTQTQTFKLILTRIIRASATGK